MLLDKVTDLGQQADVMSSVVEDHSQQLGELSVTVQTMQEMMGAQQEWLMALGQSLLEWSQRLMAREEQVNNQLNWLRSRIEPMDVDEEEEEDDEEAMTSTEVDKGSPEVVLDSDLDDFGSPELEVTPTPARRGDFGGQVNQLVRIEEELLDEVEWLVLLLCRIWIGLSIGWSL